MRRVWMWIVLGTALLAAGCPQPIEPVVGDSIGPLPAPASQPAAPTATKPGGPARGGLHRPLSADEENELLSVVKKFKEADHNRLVDLKATDPGQYRAQMRLMWIWYGEWKTLPAPVQDAYWALREAKADSAGALVQLSGETNAANREKLLARLRQAQGREFDALQVIQTQWAEEFAQRITKLQGEIDIRRKGLETMRTELKARQGDREKILEGKVNSLLKNPPTSQPAF